MGGKVGSLQNVAVTDERMELMANICPVTSCMVNINHNNAQLLNGNHYFIKKFIFDQGVINNTTYFSFKTPVGPTRISLIASIVPDSDCEITIYEGATITNGTPVVIFNNERESDRPAQLTAVDNPDITTLGMPLWPARTGGGVKETIGNKIGANYPIVVKKDTVYVIACKKKTAPDSVVDIDIWWNEFTPKT